MAGIIFFETQKLEEIVEFYTSTLGMKIWLEQKSCTILSHGNLLLGFCLRNNAEIEGMITLFYKTQRIVDQMYERVKHLANTEPRKNEVYNIYQFFAKDPEGRDLEFQAFLHKLTPLDIEDFLK
ncbi:MAG: VOC family protein [Candidatus Lokiarchaeota archaeon]|nr:VOC family protein [Candidatus Lokiarchaeota archaeon]